MTYVNIRRLPKPNDPYLRISICGNAEIGFYCRYRGIREEAVDALEKILLVMQNMPEQEIESEP